MSSAGSAVSDIFGAIGSFESAAAYDKAKGYAEQNVAITKKATAIQEQQAQRQIYQAIGAQKSAVGASGFAQTGSASDIIRATAQQGALSRTLIATQGQITENNFAAEAAAYGAQASSDMIAGIGDAVGGAMNIAAMFIGG